MADRKKSPRKRMKGIYDKIIHQMEFYFSDANLSRDRFMKQKIDDTSDGFLELSMFLNFNKLKNLSTDLAVIAKALSFSNSLQLNEDKTKIKRTKPYTPPKDTDERTVYVECLPHKTNHEWISTLFSSCGKVTYVSLPKYKSTGDRKGFAFVEFEDVESARKACEELNNPPVEAGNKPGKFPKTNKQLLYYRDRVSGQTNDMEDENEKNDEKAEEASKSKPTESLGRSKKAKKRRRMTSESSVDGAVAGERKSSTHSVEERESDSSTNEGSPKKRRKQQGRESLDSSKEVKGDSKGKKQTETLKNDEDIGGKRKMPQSRKSVEDGKDTAKASKKSDKKEKGAGEDVKHSDLSDSNSQDTKKESKKRKHSNQQSVEGELPIKQRKQESEKEVDSVKEEKKRKKKKKERRKRKKSHKDKTLPELRVLPKKEWLKLREEYLSLQKRSMSELKESLKQIKQNQPVDTVENGVEKVTKAEVTTELVETPNVIIRVQCASDMNRKQIKEDLGTEVNVAYIDVKEGARDGYIRFKDADSATKISESTIKSYLFTLLKGEDEKTYWQKLKSDREAKHNSKSSRKKIKGTQKLIDKAEKVNRENISRVHIKFDNDDDE